jgi:Protein of unknown function (DUF3164)
MPIKDEHGRWIDAAGNHVPPKYVGTVEKKRDMLVERLFKRAMKAQEQLRKFKEVVDADVAKYLDWLAESHGEEALSPGGNYELLTFAGDKQLCVDVNKVIAFDERLQLAKQKINTCLELWSDGADDKLKAVVFDAFKVDRKGQLDSKRILGLRTLKINDKDWQEAMDLIGEAITITGTRRYIRFRVKDTKDAEWRTIRLDLAGV